MFMNLNKIANFMYDEIIKTYFLLLPHHAYINKFGTRHILNIMHEP